MAQAVRRSLSEDRDEAGPAIEFPGKYLGVTSYRANGSAVTTPVWFVQEGRSLLVETDANSFKVRRIRRNPAVTVAPCTASGKLRGEQVPATAIVLGPDELERVHALMGRKYRIDRIMVLPIYHLVQKLQHKTVPKDQQHPVIVEITPTA